MHSSGNATATIHHIEGIPTEALAKKIADDWVNYPQPKGCGLRVFASTEPLVLTQQNRAA